MFFTLSSKAGGHQSKSRWEIIIASKVLDPIRRVNGVGEADLFGAEYAMRIWLDPAKLESFNLTANDVIAAIQAQNVQVAAGQLGALPGVERPAIERHVAGPTHVVNAGTIRQILLRVNPDGSRVLLHDVARIAFGGQNYSTFRCA